MSYLNLSVKRAFVLVLILIFSTQSGFSQLTFNNPQLVSGNDLQEGAVYRYENVAPFVNAIITIAHIENGSTLLHLDENGFGYDGGFQPLIQSGGKGESYVLFNLQFVSTQTGMPYNFSSLTATILDIDGSNQLKEFAELNMNYGVAALLNSSPQINLQTANGVAKALNTAGIEVGGISTSATEVMFKQTGIAVSSFQLKFGTVSETGSHASRQYSLYFNSFTLPSTLPVSLLDFQVTLKDKSANLSWATTNHYNFSHFVIEKSTDAVNFTEAAILFAPTTSAAENTFTYNDNLKNSTAKTYYYRLKMTDTDGKYSYSDTRMVRLTAAATATVISTFPNPVVNEVRVMIPESWQDKKVVYEIYNTTGVLLQRSVAGKAAQIQQLNVQPLSSGTYVLRVSTANETATTKLIK
jgi:choline dehydrogenase-like flavoprotein